MTTTLILQAPPTENGKTEKIKLKRKKKDSSRGCDKEGEGVPALERLLDYGDSETGPNSDVECAVDSNPRTNPHANAMDPADESASAEPTNSLLQAYAKRGLHSMVVARSFERQPRAARTLAEEKMTVLTQRPIKTKQIAAAVAKKVKNEKLSDRRRKRRRQLALSEGPESEEEAEVKKPPSKAELCSRIGTLEKRDASVRPLVDAIDRGRGRELGLGGAAQNSTDFMTAFPPRVIEDRAVSMDISSPPSPLPLLMQIENQSSSSTSQEVTQNVGSEVERGRTHVSSSHMRKRKLSQTSMVREREEYFSMKKPQLPRGASQSTASHEHSRAISRPSDNRQHLWLDSGKRLQEQTLGPTAPDTHPSSSYNRLLPANDVRAASDKKSRKAKRQQSRSDFLDSRRGIRTKPQPGDKSQLDALSLPKSASFRSTDTFIRSSGGLGDSTPQLEKIMLECGSVLEENTILADHRPYLKRRLAVVRPPTGKEPANECSSQNIVNTKKKRGRHKKKKAVMLALHGQEDVAEGCSDNTSKVPATNKIVEAERKVQSRKRKKEPVKRIIHTVEGIPVTSSGRLSKPPTSLYAFSQADEDVPSMPKRRGKATKPQLTDTELLDSTFQDYSAGGSNCVDWKIKRYSHEKSVLLDESEMQLEVLDCDFPGKTLPSLPRALSSNDLLLDDALYTISDSGVGESVSRSSSVVALESSSYFIAKSRRGTTEFLPKLKLPRGIKPKVWALSRQEVCESLPWFRAYQSGVYFHAGVALGYLLSAFGSINDIFHHGGKFIISHGGGKSKPADRRATDRTRISMDQGETDHGVRSLINCYRSKSRIVLLADDKYRLFPYDLGHHTYVVLGFYRIVCYWAEYEEAANEQKCCVKYKFAFQWCEEQGNPWWATAVNNCGSVIPQDDNHDDLDVYAASCSSCRQQSQTVYQEGWTCFNPSCERFCQRSTLSTSSDMTYSAEFLRLRRSTTAASHNEAEWRLTVDLPSSTQTTITSKEFAKGWWCTKCGKLCCRERWESWYCSYCMNTIPISPKVVVASYEGFWQQEEELSFKYEEIAESSGITMKISRWRQGNNSGMLRTYTFPHDDARIHLIAGHSGVNEAANELFIEYQKEAFEYPRGFFRRYPLQLHQLRGAMLSNYFSQNSGAPYKYIVETNGTVPFEEAPKAVCSALKFIKIRASAALNKPINFNEILSAAYLEEQKMSYHSDSEPGLGPVVSSLSLGSLALMHFRPLKKKGIPNKRALSLVLRHGDVLVMDGAAIQDFYEHTVMPKNFRIAATARMIGRQNMTSSVRQRKRSNTVR